MSRSDRQWAAVSGPGDQDPRCCGRESRGGIMPAYRRIRSFRPVLLIAMALLAFALVVPAGSASGAPTGHVGRSGAAASAAATPSAAGAFVPVAPSRLLDTRNGVGAPKAPVKAHAAVAVQVTGLGGVPASGVSAVVVNVTATGATAAGHIAAYADGAAQPTAWTVSFARGQTV